MTDIYKQLKGLGLGENEARIYLAGLSMGAFTAGHMAAQTKIKRSTTYLALENLIKLGLMKEIINKKRKLFQVERPKALQKLTKRMRRKVIDSEIVLEKLIPELNEISQNIAEEPELSFYEGINGVKNVLLDISASNRPWYLFGASRQLIKKFSPEDISEIMDEGRKLRRAGGLPKVKFITDDGILDIPHFKRILPSREMKILKSTIKANSALIVYEDKLVVLNFSHPFAAVIKSAEVVEVITLMYSLIWDSL